MKKEIYFLGMFAIILAMAISGTVEAKKKPHPLITDCSDISHPDQVIVRYDDPSEFFPRYVIITPEYVVCYQIDTFTFNYPLMEIPCECWNEYEC